jgi:hypothetical protein
MRMSRVLAISLFWLGSIACGGGTTGGGSGGGNGGDGGGGSPLPPVDHTLAQSQPETFAAGSFYGFEFLLPAAASFSFSASETTTDTWNVAVFTPAEWVSYQDGSGNQAYAAAHNNVMQVSDAAELPAGDFYLGFRCTNAVERCMLVFDADAIY